MAAVNVLHNQTERTVQRLKGLINTLKSMRQCKIQASVLLQITKYNQYGRHIHTLYSIIKNCKLSVIIDASILQNNCHKNGIDNITPHTTVIEAVLVEIHGHILKIKKVLKHFP